MKAVVRCVALSKSEKIPENFVRSEMALKDLKKVSIRRQTVVVERKDVGCGSNIALSLGTSQ